MGNSDTSEQEADQRKNIHHSSTDEIRQCTMKELTTCNTYRLTAQEFSWAEIH